MIPVINLGAIPGGVALRPHLGAPAPFTDPDDEAFEPLEGLSEAQQTRARLDLIKSAEELEDAPRWLDDIGKVYDDWIQDATLAADHVRSELKWLRTHVFQRTGAPEAERDLATAWIKIGRRALEAMAHPPSTWRTGAVTVVQFIIWMLEGAQEAWQEYSASAISSAGPLLEEYHGGVNRIRELRLELEEAKVGAGYEITKIAEQERAISRAETALEAARNAYWALSAGGSIDDVSQGVFGEYRLGVALSLILALKVVVIAGVIGIFVALVSVIFDLAEKSPLLLVGGLVALGAIILLPGIVGK